MVVRLHFLIQQLAADEPDSTIRQVLDQVRYPGNKYAWYLSPSILKWYRSILKKISADQVSSDISTRD